MENTIRKDTLYMLNMIGVVATAICALVNIMQFAYIIHQNRKQKSNRHSQG